MNQAAGLILPGYGNSGPEHWQSRWEALDPSLIRVEQGDWDFPDREEWVDTLEQRASALGRPVVVAAHSLGCLLLAHWAARTRCPILGALLVAPPNPEQDDFPPQIRGFHPFPRTTLRFASIVVGSTNDQYADMRFTRACAANWGSAFLDLGAAGHINSESGFGPWPQGYAILQQLYSSNSG